MKLASLIISAILLTARAPGQYTGPYGGRAYYVDCLEEDVGVCGEQAREHCPQGFNITKITSRPALSWDSGPDLSKKHTMLIECRE